MAINTLFDIPPALASLSYQATVKSVVVLKNTGAVSAQGIYDASVATGRGVANATCAAGRGVATAGYAAGRGVAAVGNATGRGAKYVGNTGLNAAVAGLNAAKGGVNLAKNGASAVGGGVATAYTAVAPTKTSVNQHLDITLDRKNMASSEKAQPSAIKAKASQIASLIGTKLTSVKNAVVKVIHSILNAIKVGFSQSKAWASKVGGSIQSNVSGLSSNLKNLLSKKNAEVQGKASAQ